MPHIARLVLYLAFCNSLSCINEHDVLKVHPCCRLQALLEYIHVVGAQLGLSPPPILEEQRAEGRECWHWTLYFPFIQSQTHPRMGAAYILGGSFLLS